MIEVRDNYQKDKWDSIDFYTSTLADVPLSSRLINSTLVVVKKFSSLFKHNSTLLVKSRLFCAKNYFGAQCEKYCDESTNNIYYECEPLTGEKICKNGFLGQDCQIRKPFFVNIYIFV
jgi:hypothetical protein